MLRPLAGFASLARIASPPGERAAIAFFGVRAVGSVYYLAYALNKGDFPAAPTLWAVAAFVILLSAALHGVTAFPVMRRLDDSRAS